MTSKIKQWLSWIVNEVFLDSYKHLSKMFDFIRNSKIDGENKRFSGRIQT